jgi:hypothetical protein
MAALPGIGGGIFQKTCHGARFAYSTIVGNGVKRAEPCAVVGGFP